MSERPGAGRLPELGPLIARVGAIAALAVAVVVVFVVLTGSGGTYRVNAIFDDARGLIGGGEVRAGGLKVGTITDVKLGDDGLPRVTMEVDSDFQLRQGAFANERLASNVGAVNRFVELTQGAGPALSDGATLGPSSTDQPVNLDQAVAVLQPRTRRQLAHVLAGLDQATRGRGDELNRALRYSATSLNATADLLSQVSIDRLALRSLVADGSRVVGVLARSPGDLGVTAERTATLLGIAARRQQELGRSAAALGPGLHSARTALARLALSIPHLRALVHETRPAVDALAPVARELPPAIAALRPFLRETKLLIRDGPAQFRAMAPEVAAAIPVTRELDPVLRLLNPVLDHLRARAPEVVGFFQLGGDATSNYDANGNMIRSTAIPINTARHPNKIRASSSAAGSLIRPFDRLPGVLEGEPWRHYWRSFIGGGRNPRHYISPSERGP